MNIFFFLVFSLSICKILLTDGEGEPEYVEFKLNVSDKPIQPLILVNGLGGGGLDAKLQDVHVEHWWCEKNHDWFRLWISVDELIPYLSAPCFLHNIKINFNETSKNFYNNKGVTVRPTDYGGTEGVEYMTKTLKKASSYMKPLVDFFVQAGYVKGKSIRAGNFDWRLGPQEWEKEGVFLRLQSLIEETYEINNQQKINILGHSLGGPYVGYFLATQVSQEWKDKYISQFFSIAGSYDGGFETVPTLLKGKYSVLPVDMRSVFPWIGGLLWTIPTKNYQDEVLIVTPNKNYTNSEESLRELFSEIGIDNAFEALKYVREADPTKVPPKVKTYCFKGVGFKTPKTFYFNKLSDPNYKVIDWWNKGDTTVLPESTQYCELWADKQEQEVIVRDFEGKKWKEKNEDYHRFMPSDPEVLEAMYKAMYED